MHTNAQTNDGTLPFAADPDERHEIARFHAALFPTRLALSRWQHGGHIPHLHYGAPALRAAWYATARRDFQAWLDRGGFCQHEEAPVAGRPHQVADCQPAGDDKDQQVRTCN